MTEGEHSEENSGTSDLWLALAREYRRAGHFFAARGAARRATQVDPRCAAARHLLGELALECGDPESAMVAFREASRLRSGSGDLARSLADAYRIGRRSALSLLYAAMAIRLQKNVALNHAVLGDALCLVIDAPRFEGRASRAYRRALELDPNCVRALNGVAALAQFQGNWEEAWERYGRVLEVDPKNAEARYRRALLNLRWGRYRQGYAEYSAVMDRLEDRIWYFYHLAGVPLWRGEQVGDRHLVISYEPGLGDYLMMARFLPSVCRYARNVTVEAPPELVDLLARNFGSIRFQPANYWQRPTRIDAHLPIMQLPAALGVAGPHDVRSEVPYLRPDPVRLESLRSRLRLEPALRHVGIVWRGNSKSPRDRWRSTQLVDWAPLRDASGVQFHSLQIGATDEEIDRAPFALAPTHRFISDFDDTAAIMTLLDLVISVDTSTLHLAGGLGRQVWMPNSLVSDFRWGVDGIDSPWYPSLRQFRQIRRGDWSPVFGEIALALGNAGSGLVTPGEDGA